MDTERIVITGGPGTGKTVLVEYLERLGCYCFPEIIRELTLKAKQDQDPSAIVSNPVVFVDDPLEFNNLLLDGRLGQYKRGAQKEISQVFYDRGMPDVLAYMDYFDQAYGDGFWDTCMNHRYDRIFLLPPWKEIYKSDGERFENFKQAVDLYHHLKKTYTDLGYAITEVPIGTVAQRALFILENC